jgi:hypothetical protein
MDDTADNDLIEQLVSQLTPQGKEVLEEFLGIEDALASGEITVEEADDRMEAPLKRMYILPPKDRDILPRVMTLKAQEHNVAAQEAAQEAERFEGLSAMIVRAQELERAGGKEPREHMTLGEAIKVLQERGELPRP